MLADLVRWSNQHGLTSRIDVPTGRRTEPDLSNAFVEARRSQR
jgi:hypothetical protein